MHRFVYERLLNMPKIKTHKATAKRFKRRKSGSIKRGKAFATHLLGGRSTKRKRAFRKKTQVARADLLNVQRALQLK
jgi:large subunit ribosomal protein L35